MRRRENFAHLYAFFEAYEEWFHLPRQNAEAVTAWLAFPLILKDAAPFDRRTLQTVFESAGVQTRLVFTGNILRQPGFSGMIHTEDTQGYPNADRVMSSGMLLGCHQGMGLPELDYMTDVFTGFAGSL